MTTHDQDIEADPMAERLEPAAATTAKCSPNIPAEHAAGQQDPIDQGRGAADPTAERSLFGGDDLASLRSRWDDVQAGFVDDPRACVQKADGLVSDVVEQLVNSFSTARANLEDQWARGEEASTEDLRIALKHYREFFQKLLAV